MAHTGLNADSEVARVLMPGEGFQAFEEPKEVSGGAVQTIYRLRALKDGAEGVAVCGPDQELQQWHSKYKVLRPIPMTVGSTTNEAADAVEVIRDVETNELVEVIEQPVDDFASGVLRLRCVAADGSVGWVSVSDGGSTGSYFLRPATTE